MNQILTAQQLGIPESLFNDFKNVVAVTKKTGGFKTTVRSERRSVSEIAALQAQFKLDRMAALAKGLPVSSVKAPSFYKYVTYIQPGTSTVQYGMYLLNYIHDLIWENGYTYEGKVSNKHTFHCKDDSFLAADGNVYEDFDQYVTITKENGKWIIEQTNELPVRMLQVPDVANKVQIGPNEYHIPMMEVQFSVAEIAANLKWTEDQVIAWDRDFILCEERDPSKYVTSIFPRFSDNGLEFGTYISGTLGGSELLKGKVSNNGKPISDYDIEFMALNNCAQPDIVLDAESQGNFGECADAWYENEEDAKLFSFDFDLNQPVAVTVFAVEVSAPNGTPNGHYERWHAYYDHKNNRVMQSPSDN